MPFNISGIIQIAISQGKLFGFFPDSPFQKEIYFYINTIFSITYNIKKFSLFFLLLFFHQARARYFSCSGHQKTSLPLFSFIEAPKKVRPGFLSDKQTLKKLSFFRKKRFFRSIIFPSLYLRRKKKNPFSQPDSTENAGEKKNKQQTCIQKRRRKANQKAFRRHFSIAMQGSEGYIIPAYPTWPVQEFSADIHCFPMRKEVIGICHVFALTSANPLPRNRASGIVLRTVRKLLCSLTSFSPDHFRRIRGNSSGGSSFSIAGSGIFRGSPSSFSRLECSHV